MKGIDIFCASPASTAICSSMDHYSMVRNGTRQNDHYHYLDDKQKTQSRVPCSSQLPIVPKPKSRKSSAKHRDSRRKSSADITDLTSPTGHSSRYLLSDSSSVGGSDDSARVSAKISESCPALVQAQSAKSRQRNVLDSRRKVKTTEPYSIVVSEQAAKTRQLNFNDSKPAKTRQLNSNDSKPAKTSDPFSALIHADKTKSRQQSSDSQPALKTSLSARSGEQAVALRVSIHCKGCEKKLKKHISKIEGVTSFSIDFAAKKVIIKGDVTPLGVLASVSKVKNAQLWQSPTSSSPSWSS